MLIQQSEATRKKLTVARRMDDQSGRAHLEHDSDDRFGQIKLKARCRRTCRVRLRKPYGNRMIDCRPKLPRPIPSGSALLIDAIQQKIVRAGCIRSMMKSEGALTSFLVGLEELERLSTQLREFVGTDAGPTVPPSSGSPKTCHVCGGSGLSGLITKNPRCSNEPVEQSHQCATCDGTDKIQ